MALPGDLESCEPAPAIPVECCGSVFDAVVAFANHLIAETATCFAVGPCDSPVVLEVSHGAPGTPCCNTLFVWLNAVSLQPGRSTDRFGAQVCNPLWRLDIGIRLLEGCFPTPTSDGAQIFAPDPAAVAKVLPTLYSHGQAVFAAAIGYEQSGRCNGVTINRMAPIPPSGGCAGFEYSVTLGGVLL